MVLLKQDDIVYKHQDSYKEKSIVEKFGLSFFHGLGDLCGQERAADLIIDAQFTPLPVEVAGCAVCGLELFCHIKGLPQEVWPASTMEGGGLMYSS
jgi:hypothetical protein